MSVPKLPSLSVFLPCYNEAPSIKPLVNQLLQFIPQIAKQYQIIIINDGSTDDTLVISQKLASRHKQVCIYSHPKNLGYGAAIQSGIKQSTSEWVFYTDGDGQFKIEEIRLFIPHIQNYQAIIGYRKSRAEGFLRALNARIFKIFVDLLFRVHVKDIDCAFKLFNAQTLKSLPLQSTGAMISAEILYRLKKKKIRFKQIPVSHLPRKFGSPTGNHPSVVIKAGIEAIKLYFDIKLASLKS